MIIHYETNGSDEGLELFDKLSQSFDKYDGVQSVSKQYYTCKYTKSNAIKIGSLYKWFYDAFPEEKQNSFLTKNDEYMTTKEKFEKVVFMLNNPVCFVIEHENSIQMLKLNELRIWGKLSVSLRKIVKMSSVLTIHGHHALHSMMPKLCDRQLQRGSL